MRSDVPLEEEQSLGFRYFRYLFNRKLADPLNTTMGAGENIVVVSISRATGSCFHPLHTYSVGSNRCSVGALVCSRPAA